MFILAVEILRIYPQFLRADMGSETAMIMNAHWQLHQAQNPAIPHTEVILYGSSTQNVRIESWWKQLIIGQLNKYLVSISTQASIINIYTNNKF